MVSIGVGHGNGLVFGQPLRRRQHKRDRVAGPEQLRRELAVKLRDCAVEQVHVRLGLVERYEVLLADTEPVAHHLLLCAPNYLVRAHGVGHGVRVLVSRRQQLTTCDRQRFRLSHGKRLAAGVRLGLRHGLVERHEVLLADAEPVAHHLLLRAPNYLVRAHGVGHGVRVLVSRRQQLTTCDRQRFRLSHGKRLAAGVRLGLRLDSGKQLAVGVQLGLRLGRSQQLSARLDVRGRVRFRLCVVPAKPVRFEEPGEQHIAGRVPIKLRHGIVDGDGFGSLLEQQVALGVEVGEHVTAAEHERVDVGRGDRVPEGERELRPEHEQSAKRERHAVAVEL